MIPPKFNFSQIGHVANHYTWTEVTTSHFDPTYYWILMGSQWTLHYVHFFTTFHIDITMFSILIPPLLHFIGIPLHLATLFNFFMYLHAYIFQMFQFIRIIFLHQYHLFPYRVTTYEKTTCFAYVYTYGMNGVFHSYDQSIYIHVPNMAPHGDSHVVI